MEKKKIQALFQSRGKKITLDVSKPFLADDSKKIYFIEKGKINLSGTKVVANEAVGKVVDFVNLNAGESFFGIRLKDYNSICFLASPQEETILFELTIGDLIIWRDESTENRVYFNEFIKSWVSVLYRGLEQEGGHPLEDHIARAGWSGEIKKNDILTTKNNIVWLETSNPKALLFNDLVEIELEDVDLLIPISRLGFVRATEDIQVSSEKGGELFHFERIWKSLQVFHDLVTSIELVLLNRESEEERERLIKKHQIEDEEVSSMLEEAKSILTSSKEDPLLFKGAQTKSDFFNACAVLAKFIDVKLVMPPDLENVKDPLDEISRYSSVRYREIILEGPWYKTDSGPFLGFLKEDGIPVALLPKGDNGYEAFNVSSKEKFIVDEQNFTLFRNFGFMLYKPFPVGKLGVKELFKFSISKDKSDYIRILSMSFIVTLLGMMVPLLTAVLFDNVIPNAAKSELIYVAFGLGMAAMGAFLFNLTKSISLLRVESKMDQKLQAGIWDRLLNLPTTFFSQYSAGDLAMRSLSIGQIRRLLSGVALSSMLAVVFSSLNLLLLFYFSVTLAWFAILLVLIQISVNIVTGKMQIAKQRDLLAKSGKTAGIVLQMLTGISKFRVTGTEKRAFNHWMRHFLPVKSITISLSRIQNFQTIFNKHYGLISKMVIFILMIKQSSGASISIGEFLSFSAAYGIFSGAMMQMSNSLITVLQVGPLYERTKSILDEEPENTEAKEAPSELKGNIELNDIHFSYDKDGPLILNKFSLEIKSGEYVALVGPSGSGKSTIIRLLLGFNKAQNGAIYYDGQDFSHLDARMVRKKIGVVLQDGSLVAGDIFTNIIGSSTTLNINDAWRAAREAAFDKDIESMPMGMHTVVSESGGTISGGQRQRLMIARALVHRPNILIFDEATSALDNRTQKIVSDSLDQLNVTRIVVAHRLSTIQNADTICYLENGSIQEKGNYEELMALKGKFYELAKRQLE